MAHSDRSTQMPLDLGHGSAMSRDDFIVTASNQDALNFIENWPNWPSPAALLIGPVGSGKTHLATIWSAESNASVLAPDDIDHFLQNAESGTGAVILEDIDRSGADETSFFHLLNFVKSHGNPLLISARSHPAQEAGLPDLASRLKALPAAVIREPDDMLLAGVITKLFADRQVAIDPSVVSYLTARMERSLSAAAALVGRIDALALARKAKITRPLIAEVLEEDTL